MSEADKGYLPKQRFNIPDDYRRWKSPYQMDSEEYNILQKEGISPTFTKTVLLSTAQTPQNPLELQQQGRAFKFMGLTTATLFDFSANTGIETNVTTAIIGVWINKVGAPSDAFFVKHGSGFRGDFLKLYLFWPAQANNSGRITIFNYDGQPWQSGDSST